jgi:hypothetical protein
MSRVLLLSLVVAGLCGCSVECDTSLGALGLVTRAEGGFIDTVNVLAAPDVLCQSRGYAADTGILHKKMELSPARWEALHQLLETPGLVDQYRLDAVSPGSEMGASVNPGGATTSGIPSPILNRALPTWFRSLLPRSLGPWRRTP